MACTKKERLISKNLIIYECNNCKLIQLQRFKEKFIKISILNLNIFLQIKRNYLKEFP